MIISLLQKWGHLIEGVPTSNEDGQALYLCVLCERVWICNTCNVLTNAWQDSDIMVCNACMDADEDEKKEVKYYTSLVSVADEENPIDGYF